MPKQCLKRANGRACDELRKVKVTPGFVKSALGSVLMEMGSTRVICTASMEEKAPGFLKGKGTGWITAEYGMLPASTSSRSSREASRGKQGGRTVEIQRLIGRSLRAVVDLAALGERTIWIDCDVIEADGGTRTASITGGFMALGLALKAMKKKKIIKDIPIKEQVAAVSVGIKDDSVLLDLDYPEDSNAHTDMNVVMTDKGRIVEIQGTAEQEPFTHKQLQAMLKLADKGIKELCQIQKKIL